MPTVLTIERDDYFSREQPEKSEEQINRVKIITQPLQPAVATSQVYKTRDLITLEPSTSYTFTAEYGSKPVLITGATASIADSTGGILTILSATFYPWGAVVIVENNDATTGSANVIIEGYALSVQGKETIVSEDADSINDNGIQEYSYPENHLIQNSAVAQLIATALLASYKQYRKDVSINWRGNPALELADDILVTTYERGAVKVQESFRVYKNQIAFDGALNQVTDGRKI